MRSKAIFMALLAFTFGAQAVPVSQLQAVSAVNHWVRSGQVLGVRFGAQADATRARTYAVQGVGLEATFHAVPFRDGRGTVFVSGNTESQAIVCFTRGDMADLPEDSPLYRILAADALFRAQFGQASKSSGGGLIRPSVASGWMTLGVNPLTGAATPIEEKDAPALISDLRVAPLLTTRWTQPRDKLIIGTLEGDVVVTNLTRNAYYDGCTATAAAQIMKYWSYPEKFPLPEDPVEALKAMAFKCKVDGTETTLMIRADSYIPGEDGSISNSPYAWDAMMDEPTADNYAEYVNHILFDISVALGSDYTPTGTGAAPKNTAKMFAQSFGYSSAFVYWDDVTYQSAVGGLHAKPLREKTIYANLDARQPVQLGIYGYDKADGKLDMSTWEGHAVVADGYGFTSANGASTAYVHINLGWGGQDDAWYNIPDIDTAKAGATADDQDGVYFKFLGSATFNVTTNAAIAGKELLTGRLTDTGGFAFPNATVTATAEDGTVATAESDENGIYWFALPGGKAYDVRAEKITESGVRMVGRVRKPVELGVTEGDADGVIADKDNVGNRWGNDMTMIEPTVRIVRGGAVADEYESLDLALAEVQDDDRVEICKPTTLAVDSFIASNVTICATNADPYAAMITRINGATLSITNGSAVLSNIVFKTEASTPVFVTGKGKVKIAGKAVFDDIVSCVPGLVMTNAVAFQLIGALENGVTISNAAATAAGEMFGVFGGEVEAASNTASRVVFSGNVDFHGVAIVNEDDGQRQLVWIDDSAVDPAVAVARVGDTYYRTLDRAFEANPDGGEIVITKSGTRIAKPHVLGADYSLSGEAGGSVEVIAEDPFGFVITNGTLTVDGVAFNDVTGPGLFVVNGGALALSNSSIDGAVGTNEWSGAVAVRKGTANLTNVVIRNCRTTGKKDRASNVYRAYGGGAYVGGAEASLYLTDCTIEDCWATSEGGGIAVRPGGTLGLGGKTVVRNNTCGENLNQQKNDICFADPDGRVLVTGQLSGDRTVGVRYNTTNGVGNRTNDVFAVIDLDAVASSNACADVFFNDTDENVEAVASGDKLVWQGIKETYGTNERQPTSLVRVTTNGVAGTARYYDRIKYVPAELTGDEDRITVELLGDDTYPADLAFACDTTLTTADELAERATLASTGDGVIQLAKGQSLTVGDIELDVTVQRDDQLTSKILLSDEIDGAVTVVEPVKASVFGEVAADLFGSDMIAATNCAAKFSRAAPAASGMVATNETGDAALLVWSDAFDPSGKVVVGGTTYYGIGEFAAEPEIVIPDPIAFTSIEKIDNEWVLVATNAKQWCRYSLWSGTDLNTNEYVAVIDWFQWTDPTGPITNNVPANESEPARFWIIRGAPGEIPQPQP